jgi:toxin CcdB
MARYDVYRNANKATRTEFPYLLDVQADLLAGLPTRVVVPLTPRASLPLPMARLQPVFSVEGKAMVMVTTELAGIASDQLGAKVASLAAHGADIIGALDFLLSGA